MTRKRKVWNLVALGVALAAGSVNAVVCVERLAHGDFLHATVSALFVMAQPTLYRVMTS